LKTLDWKGELNKQASKFHLAGAWVAIVFNPIFGIADYFNINHHWEILIALRLLVALCSLVGIFLYKNKKISVEILVLIPFLGIILQNTYMYAVIRDAQHLQQHTYSFLAVFFAGGLFILWERKYTIIVVALAFLASAIALPFNVLPFEDVVMNGGLLIYFVAIITIFVIDRRYQSTKSATISRLEVEQQAEIITQKSKQITRSIQYAKRIQNAIFPHVDTIKGYLSDFFVLFMPRDIVSGDFYWCEKKNDKVILALADCTGHGVPGAFMSMVGNALLREIVLEKEITEPAKILDTLRKGVIESLHQSGKTGEAQDGMDISLCMIDYQNEVVEFAGAFNSLLHIRGDEISIIKGDKQPIGIYPKTTDFTNNRIEIQKGDLIYLFTDGYQDQFGGENNQKITSKRLRNLIIEIKNETMQKQEEILKENFLTWKGDYQQIDDVSLIGFKL
jgi:serine phosphatase RsbU (regulator of sigma subunit)